MHNILEDASSRLLSNLKSLTINKFTINIEDIRKEMLTENTWLAVNRKEPQQPLNKLFKNLDEIKKSCLYWYEVENEEIADEMLDSLSKFKADNNQKKLEENRRSLPAKGRYSNKNSKVLYVGTVKARVRKRDGLTTISSRTFQHLGFYEKGRTGGLHLWYWAKHSVTLKVIELPEDFPEEYRTIAEKLLAIELKPLIGTH